MNILFGIVGFFVALLLVTSITLFMLQVMWVGVIFVALGAGYFGLRSKGIHWDRIKYAMRLFVYRQLYGGKRR